jgi:hypothetical protein
VVGGVVKGGRRDKGGDGGRNKVKWGSRGKRGPRGKGRVSAKKVIVLSNSGQAREAPHFTEYPADIVGLVLLRVMAERPGSGLTRGRQEEVNKQLESLREEVGVGSNVFEFLTTVCRSMVMRWRVRQMKARGGQPSGQGEDSWWWEFDHALQTASRDQVAAHRELRASTQPSFFARTLTQKAKDAASVSLTAKEAATARARGIGGDAGGTADSTGELNQLDWVLGATRPSNFFLKSVGDRIAQARQNLESNTTTTTTSPNAKRSRGTSAPPPPPKRRKPSTTDSSPEPLPCINCSESLAARARVHTASQRMGHREFSAHPDPTYPYLLPGSTTPYNSNKYMSYVDPDPKPWLKPLMWAFHMDLEAAMRVRSADEFFRLVVDSRAVEVVDAIDAVGGLSVDGGAVKFMVDVAGDRTRVVLMEMRGVFDVLKMGYRVKGKGGTVRFVPPPVVVSEGGVVLGAAEWVVGNWEDWRWGCLEGSRPV